MSNQNIWGFPSNQSTTFEEALGYKKYVALIKPKTGPPDYLEVTVLEDSIGGVVIDNKTPGSGDGNFKVICFGGFFPDKTIAFGTGNYVALGGDVFSVTAWTDGSTNELYVGTADSSGWIYYTDYYFMLEIRVYP